eukprot:m.66537 g.66537  ORF g.66537 m.66537 type:complete len:383 (+) comp19731_c0_seq2:469-1617(+)
MRKTPLNSRTQRLSPEFWFSRPGAGAKAHTDEHCVSTMSVQLSGSKRWRLMLIPPIDHILTRPEFADGLIYKSAHWNPDFEFTLNPGEGLFIPPNILHETTNVGDSCAVSVTYQWGYPAPTKYIRSFLPRFSLTEEMEHCTDTWEPFATLLPPGAIMPEKSEEKVQEQAAIRNIVIDKDQNNLISKAEIRSWLEEHWQDEELAVQMQGGFAIADAAREHMTDEDEEHDVEAEERYVVTSERREELLYTWTEQIFHYNDRDENGQVTTEEFSATFVEFHAIMAHSFTARAALKFVKNFLESSECEDTDEIWTTFLETKEPPTTNPSSLSLECQQLVLALRVAHEHDVNLDPNTYDGERLTEQYKDLFHKLYQQNPIKTRHEEL